MNEIKLMEDAFNFLLEKGFIPTSTKSNLEYCIIYSSSNLNIILNYDLRTHQFDIGIVISKNKHESYIPLFEVRISNEIYKQQTLNKIKSVYLSAQKDWTISKKHFCAIIDLYSEFLNQNIEEILAIS